MIKQVILLLTLVCATMVGAAENHGVNWHNRELIIRGDYLRAILAAYEDFSIRMAERADTIVPFQQKSDKELQDYLSKLENYTIEVGFGRNQYLVWINPRASSKFPVVFGGGAFYVIDAMTFKLLEKNYGK